VGPNPAFPTVILDANTAYIERLRSVEAHISMAAGGNFSQNAIAENFIKTLTTEEGLLKQYQAPPLQPELSATS